MRQCTITIPTLLTNKYVLKMLVTSLSSDESVYKIILINNALLDQNNFDDLTIIDKVYVYTPESNMYVNPSWNYGVLNCTTEYFGLLNDDLLLHDNFVSAVLSLINDNDGLFGMKASSVHDDKQCSLMHVGNLLKMSKKVSNNRNNFWGIAIFGKVQDYPIIPENMKIWCGDDYIHAKCKKQCYSIECEPKIMHYHSIATRSNKDFTKIKYNDLKIYKENYIG